MRESSRQVLLAFGSAGLGVCSSFQEEIGAFQTRITGVSRSYPRTDRRGVEGEQPPRLRLQADPADGEHAQQVPVCEDEPRAIDRPQLVNHRVDARGDLRGRFSRERRPPTASSPVARRGSRTSFGPRSRRNPTRGARRAARRRSRPTARCRPPGPAGSSARRSELRAPRRAPPVLPRSVSGTSVLPVCLRPDSSVSPCRTRTISVATPGSAAQGDAAKPLRRRPHDETRPGGSSIGELHVRGRGVPGDWSSRRPAATSSRAMDDKVLLQSGRMDLVPRTRASREDRQQGIRLLLPRLRWPERARRRQFRPRHKRPGRTVGVERDQVSKARTR